MTESKGSPSLSGEGQKPVSLRASVVIPAYNAERTLPECLDALDRQTLPRGAYEVIVVDDGSTDGTAKVARRRGATLLRQPIRSGAAAARNAGAACAQGDYLVFIDADCEAAEDWLEQMLHPFCKPGVSAVYGAYSTRQRSWVARFAQAEFEERYERLLRCEHIDFLATHAAAFRRAVFEESGGFRPELQGNEDVEIAFRLSQRGHNLVFAPRALVYHEHPATLWSYLRTKVSRGYWRAIVYARYPGRAVSDSYTPPWLKLQGAGLALMAVVAVLSLLWPRWLPALVLPAGLVLLTTLPSVRFVRRRHPDLCWMAPALALLRTAALVLGAVAGLLAAAVGVARGAR